MSSPVCPQTPTHSHVYSPDMSLSQFPPLPSLYATIPRVTRRSGLAPSPDIPSCPSERRRRQYKSTDSSLQKTPTKTFGRAGSAEPQRTQVLRHNMKDLIFRTRKELRRKRSFGSSSDGIDFDMDNEEDEEANGKDVDEDFYCRVINNTNSKIKHSYRRSYANEVGSSLDPDMEDITKWERELNYNHGAFYAAPVSHTEPEPLPEFDADAMIMDDMEELRAYADDAEALDELSNMTEAELLALLEETDVLD